MVGEVQAAERMLRRHQPQRWRWLGKLATGIESSGENWKRRNSCLCISPDLVLWLVLNKRMPGQWHVLVHAGHSAGSWEDKGVRHDLLVAAKWHNKYNKWPLTSISWSKFQFRLMAKEGRRSFRLMSGGTAPLKNGLSMLLWRWVQEPALVSWWLVTAVWCHCGRVGGDSSWSERGHGLLVANSQPGVVLLPLHYMIAHLALSKDMFGCQVGGGRCYWNPVTRDAAQHPMVHTTALHNKESSSPRSQYWSWESWPDQVAFSKSVLVLLWMIGILVR